MVITFTLQAAYSGATYVAGPFDISGTTSGGITTLLGDNISKADLLTGVTISDIDDSTTGGTIQSVDGICSNSINWLVSGSLVFNNLCFSLTYTTIPSDLYVRYRDTTDTTVTTLIENMETMDNGNGTYTTYVCVKQGGVYDTPVFVQGGSELSSYELSWIEGGSCESNFDCAIT
jgi:hypothetical protein